MAQRDPIRVPASLWWLRDTAGGQAWLRALPDTIAAARARWSLTLGEPYEGSSVSLVLPAQAPTGATIVLKLQFPHRESDHEATALRAWGGDGAVRLVDDAPDLGALLVERCVPGTPLAAAPATTALPILAGLVRRLAIPMTQPFTALAGEAQRWAEGLPARWQRAGRPFDRLFVDRAVELLDRLAGSQGEQVLIHQDLHGLNVLRAQRQPWLAIDPKPLHGELAFALAPIVRSGELGHGRRAVLHRLAYLSTALGVDPARARDWCFAQTVAWSIEGTRVLPRHVETARWLLAA